MLAVDLSGGEFGPREGARGQLLGPGEALRHGRLGLLRGGEDARGPAEALRRPFRPLRAAFFAQKMADFERKTPGFCMKMAYFASKMGAEEARWGLCQAFEPYYKLWTSAIDFKHSEEEWLTGMVQRLVAEEIETVVEDQCGRSFKG